jgi:dTDP-glucose 4,6-dehydratase
MKILVIGANSFSGQDFVDLLLDNPDYEVIGISRSPERSGLFLKYKSHKNLSNYRYFQIDLNKDMPILLQLLNTERPEYIVNFAAQSEVGPSWEYPEQWFQTNCVVLAQLINHLQRQDYLRRYMHISSPEVYGTCVGKVFENAPLNPSTPYAASKAAADLLLFTYFKQFNFPLVMVRSTNVYGARQQLYKIIPRSVIYLKLGKKIELHGGGIAVKSIHTRDISCGELSIIEKGQLGQIYHLSPDKGITVHDVVQLICEKMGKRFEDETIVVDERPGQDAAYVIDSTKARTEFGWLPEIKIEEGILEVIRWVEENWNEILVPFRFSVGIFARSAP